MELPCGNRVSRGQPGLIGMDMRELRALLARYRLPTSGTRLDLCRRIIQAINQNIIRRHDIQPGTSQPVVQIPPQSRSPPRPSSQPSRPVSPPRPISQSVTTPRPVTPPRRQVSPPQLRTEQIRVVEPAARPSSPPRRQLIIHPYTIPSDFCFDWHKCVQPGTRNGFDVLIIPPNTLLFKGVLADAKSRERYRRMQQMRHGGSQSLIYLADLPVAAWYAFASDNASGEYGKVITYRTTQPIYLLDMASLANYPRLTQLNVPESGVPGHGDVLDYAFGYKPETTKLKRISHPDIDFELSQWLCSLDLDGITGYGYLKLPGFHSELLICHPEDKIELYPLEYRFVVSYNPNVILETFKGQLTGREFTFAEITTPEMRVYPRYSSTNIYQPHHDPADAFLCQEPFISLRRQALMQSASAYRPYKPGDELC